MNKEKINATKKKNELGKWQAKQHMKCKTKMNRIMLKNRSSNQKYLTYQERSSPGIKQIFF